MKRALCTALAAVLLSTAHPVFAQEAAEPTAADIKAAGQEFDLGRRAFRAKEWVEAAEHFEAADARAPSTVALQLAISARDRAGQPDRAATLAALALGRHPEDKNLAKVSEAVLKKSRAELYEITVTCDEPCDLVIDTKLVHGRPTNTRTLFVPAGTYSLRAGWSHARAERKPIEATAGGKAELAFQAPPVPEEPAEEPSGAPPPEQAPPPEPDVRVEAKGGWSPTVFWVGVGLTGVAGIATVWSGIDTLNNPGEDRVRDECVGLGESCPAYQDGLANERRTNILLGVTAVLGVATAAIGAFATDWQGGDTAEQVKRRAPKRQVAVEPWLALGSGATLGARGNF
jgi:hypothetical protein